MHADVLRLASPAQHDGKLGALPWSRIHCRGLAAPTPDDKLPTFAGYEPWVADPCRPAGTPEPEVCLTSFQRVEPSSGNRADGDASPPRAWRGCEYAFPQASAQWPPPTCKEVASRGDDY